MRQCKLEAANWSFALAQAHRELCVVLHDANQDAVDRQGRVDLMNEAGSPVARIYCADMLHAMS